MQAIVLHFQAQWLGPGFSQLHFLLYFCLPLIPLGASREERDVCLLHVGMPGKGGGEGVGWGEGGLLYRDSVSFTTLIQVFWGRPLALRPQNLVLYAR